MAVNTIATDYAYGIGTDGLGGGANSPAAQVRKYVFDVPTLVTAGYTMAVGDQHEIIPVYAGDYILHVGYEVITATTATTTFDIGDGGSEARYYGAIAGDTVGRPATLYTTEYLYTANDFIELQFEVLAPTAGKILVWTYTLSVND